MKNLPYSGFLFQREVAVYQSYSCLLSHSLLYIMTKKSNNDNFWLLFSATEHCSLSLFLIFDARYEREKATYDKSNE